jgi:predicted nucleotide-binding protein
MIVHGRSNDRELVERLLHTHGVTDPIVLRERFTVGKTIPEKFEREALQADGAVVVFTPDDEAAALLGTTGEPVSADELRRRTRARQNVSLEYGWFWGRLGRDRVLLLLKGELELPSDLVGLSYHSYNLSPEECSDAIADFIKGIRDR